jgi:hypothetical protein
MYNMFLDFYNGTVHIAKSNRVAVCLTPKIPNAALINLAY